MADPILNCPVCFDPFEWDPSKRSSDDQRVESKLPVLSYVCSHKVCCSCLHGMHAVAISGRNNRTNRERTKWFKCPSCNEKTAFNALKIKIDAYACECIRRLAALQGDSGGGVETEAQRGGQYGPPKKRRKKVYDCEFDATNCPTFINVTSTTIVPESMRATGDVVETASECHDNDDDGPDAALENSTALAKDGSNAPRSQVGPSDLTEYSPLSSFGSSAIGDGGQTTHTLRSPGTAAGSNVNLDTESSRSTALTKGDASATGRTKRKSVSQGDDVSAGGESSRPTKSNAKLPPPFVAAGSRIEVYWGDNNYYPAKYYPATVTKIFADAAGMLHKLRYDDGFEASVDLGMELFNILDEPIVKSNTPNTGAAARALPDEHSPLNVRQRIGPTGQKKDLCRVDGCPKYKQNGRDGMCVAHFNASKINIVDEPIVKSNTPNTGAAADEHSPLNVRQRIGPTGQKKDFCRVDGCPKYKQNGRDGMCVAHFNASKINIVDEPIVKSNIPNTGAAADEHSPLNVRHRIGPTGQKKDFCRVDGCPKYKQNGRDGMCVAHFNASKIYGIEAVLAGRPRSRRVMTVATAATFAAAISNRAPQKRSKIKAWARNISADGTWAVATRTKPTKRHVTTDTRRIRPTKDGDTAADDRSEDPDPYTAAEIDNKTELHVNSVPTHQSRMLPLVTIPAAFRATSPPTTSHFGWKDTESVGRDEIRNNMHSAEDDDRKPAALTLGRKEEQGHAMADNAGDEEHSTNRN